MVRKAVVALCVLAAAAILYVGLSLLDREPEPITNFAYPLYVKMDLHASVAEANLIATGQVTAVKPSRWNRTNGKLPPDITARNIPPELTICSDAQFQASQIMKGKAQLSAIWASNPHVPGPGWSGPRDRGKGTISRPRAEYLLFLGQDTNTTARIKPGHHLVFGTSESIYELADGKGISAIDARVLED